MTIWSAHFDTSHQMDYHDDDDGDDVDSADTYDANDNDNVIMRS